ncbi:MAG: hypothetical protein KAT15_03235, partial [Bacteroidales bacterium]|nr:hypothetical protein [Bacteroidales bacterium]
MIRLFPLLLFISLVFIPLDLSGTTNQDSLNAGDYTEESLTGPDTVVEISDDGTTSTLLDESNRIVPRQEKFNFSLAKILRGILGMLVLILIAWVFSADRKAINWQVVLVGISIQLVLAIGILWVPAVQVFFEFVGKLFVKILDFTYAGTEFLFRSNRQGVIEPPLLNFAIT